MKKVLLIILILLYTCLYASAYDFMVDGLCFNINSDGTTVTVTYQNNSSPRYSNLSGALTIPSSVTYSGTNYLVTSIGSYAFYGCSGLTSVDIPNSVTSIGSYAFSGCSGLTSVTIPNSLTSIGDRTFGNCLGLTEVFWNAKSCTNENEYDDSPYDQTSIYENSSPFYGSINISSFVFSDEVEDIPSRLCSGLSGLTSVIIPNSVTTIGFKSFYGCSGLTSVTIPESITSIGGGAFANCSNLSSVYWNAICCGVEDHVYVDATKMGPVTTYCYDSPFSYFVNDFNNHHSSPIASFIIGDNVLRIPSYLCIGCTSLTNVTIGNSVASIGESAFWGCTGLTSIAIPNSVNSVEGMAFYQCSNLTEITIPNSVISISGASFAHCDNLKTVYWNAEVNSISNYYSFKNLLYEYDIPVISAQYESSSPFFITITETGNYAADFPVTYSIKSHINNFIIGENVQSIPSYLCRNMSDLTSVTVPNSVASIGDSAFYACSGLASATIPNSVVEIGERAFGDCISMSNIHSLIIYPNNVSLGNDVFVNVNKSNCVLTVPVTSLDIYRSAEQWKDFQNIYPDVFVTDITLNETHLSLTTGQTEILTATVSPPNAYSVLNWTSSNPSVASVDENGKVTAKSAGTTTINVATTDGSNINASCVVDVYNIATLISLNITQSTLYVGENETLVASIYPSNTIAHLYPIQWNSSNANVAVVDENGVVTAKSVGVAIITASTTDGSNLSTSCEINVVQPVTSITLNQTSASIYQSGSLTLTATVLPNNAYNNNLSWTSSNTSVATVDQNGKVTGMKVGTATITATTTDGTNLSASCDLSVTGITNIELSSATINIQIGDTETLIATITPSDVINKTLGWTSSNTSVATVDDNGIITALSSGTSTVTAIATDGSEVSASCEIIVNPAYDIYPTITEITCVRGDTASSVVIPFWMSNKTAISGLQFDITLPTGVSFAIVDNYPDVWLDANRKARNHTVDVNQISGSKYRVLVSSPTNNTFKGNEGVVMYMRLNINNVQPIGSYYINTSNVIFVEPDETQHSGYNKSIRIDYKYLLGDADADARVDIADYTVTALKILNRPVETFYTDAANVNGDSQITIADLVGITNISLGIRPHEYRPAPAITMDNEAVETTPSLSASIEDDGIVALILDNDIPLAGVQFDLQLPQGMTLGDATLEGRAAIYQLGANTLADGSVRLLISSFGDKDIETGNDAVIKLVLEGNNVNNEMLYINGAQAASRDLKSYELNEVSIPVGTTSINDLGYSYDKLSIYGKGNTIVVNSPSAMTVQLVHVNGMVMPVEIKPGHNTIEVGGHGIYIIRVGNNVYKVRL